jgi:hypothetical protein
MPTHKSPGKRGAPLRNQNARKHGRYSKVITPAELEVIKALKRLDDRGRRVVFGYLVNEFIPQYAPTLEKLGASRNPFC